MNSAETSKKAARILDRLYEVLHKQHFVEEIDAPIDQAANSFRHDEPEPASSESFHNLIAAFVAHVYKHGLRCPQKLTREQALAEAIFILRRTYRNDRSVGYEGALLDGTDATSKSLDYVLFSIAEAIKTQQQENYRRWIFAKHLDPADWQTRVEMVSILFERLRPYFPAEFLRQNPADFAGKIPNLVSSHLEVEAELRSAVGAGPKSSN